MRAGLIGLGMVSHTFADAFKNASTVTLGLVYARTPAGRTAFLERHPTLGAHEVGSVEEIAQDPSLDFVIVTTPPNARLEIIQTLAAAGKPILMEKPVERGLAAATRIVEICEAANVPLGIVFQHRARPGVAELRAQLDSLGPMMAVEASIPWWRPQSYYNEPGRGTYARDGGGVLLTQAIHPIELMLSFTGPVTDVIAMTTTTGLHQMESEDFVSAGLTFANGAVGQLFASTASFPGGGETLCFHCRDGSARLQAGHLQIDRHDGTSETLGQASTSGAGADPMAFTSDWHRAMIEDFATSLRAGRPPMVPGREALRVHALIDALERSGRSGTRVPLTKV